MSPRVLQLGAFPHPKCFLLAAALAISALSNAAASVEVFPTEGVPYYFSGTNARIHVKADVLPPDLAITRYRITIGDAVAKDVSIPLPNRPPYVGGIDIWGMFDSLKFANGTSLVVKLEVWTLAGGPYSDQVTVPVTNIALIAGRGEWEHEGYLEAGGTRTLERLQPLNLSTSRNYLTSAWTTTTIKDNIESVGVYYVNSHGSDTTITDNVDTPLYATIDFTNNIVVPRQDAIGDGLPPYNSSHKPPTWIALNDGCNSGATNAFTCLLYTKTNTYSNPLIEDQAYVGWNTESLIVKASPCAATFWDALVACKTIHQARDEMEAEYAIPNPPPAVPGTYVKVWGDPQTRLRSVYTGTDDAQTTGDWYRTIGG